MTISHQKQKRKTKFLTIKTIITMKTFKLFIAIALLFTINSFGQLDKKTWLVGGTGSFDSYKENYTYVFTGTGENIEIERNFSLFCEIKSTRPTIGEITRQINFYKQFVYQNYISFFILVAPNISDYKKILADQNILIYDYVH